MFNIGGQGQYIVGTIFAVWLGSSFGSLDPWLHVALCVVAGTLAGAAWAGIAGILKATVGAHEVISTIMLNWIAIWVGAYLFGEGGPLQGSRASIPVSNTIVEGAKLPVFWGLKLLQGLSIGIFIALAMLAVYWILVNRSTLGFAVRAVGFNPEAARYGGINVKRNYVKVMAICGIFAGLAGALDVLGWEFHIDTNDIQGSQIGFLGIAVALLGRNTASGTAAAALLFGALVNGTSSRNLNLPDQNLTSNLTYLIQGLVILFVSTDVIAIKVLGIGRRKTPKPQDKSPAPADPPAAQEQAA
jgi:simple sugar transport system permease protein